MRQSERERERNTAQTLERWN